MKARRVIAVAAAASLFAVGACSSDSEREPSARAVDDGTITVASFNFSESMLLAELYSQALEAADYPVERSFDLGPREFVVPALMRGLVELVPEYTGTALQFSSVDRTPSATDTRRPHEALVRDLRDTPVSVLAPAPAQDANTFVVRREIARREDLRTLSDLATVAPSLTFGGPPECPTRQFCLAGLEQVYGIEFGEVVALDAGGPLTHQALEDGDVDLAQLFTSDPAILNADVVELDDDRTLQPPENVVPLVRKEVLDRFGQGVADRIDAVSQRLTTAELRQLNAEVGSAGVEVALVARRWLEREGLL
jgi:osmoprotectant transport system substrate-binding protein